MSLTIEHRIMQLLSTRLSQWLVNGVSGFVILNESDTTNAATQAGIFSVSGFISESYPREFTVTVTDTNKVQIEETTIFYSLGKSQPTPLSEEIEFTDGVAFTIPGTSISITIESGSSVGMIWGVRSGFASNTITEISFTRDFNTDAFPAPSVSLYAAGSKASRDTVSTTTYEMNVGIFLCVPPPMFENGDALEILGDIRDFVNSDHALWDGDTCLAADFEYNGDEYFEHNKQGNSIFVISTTVNYRTQTKDSRLK